MEQIKEIVEKLRIKELKKEFYDNQVLLFQLERKMAALTFQPEIGRYAFRLDEIEDTIEELEKASPKKKQLLCDKLDLLYMQIAEQEKKPEILVYKDIRNYHNRILFTNNRYYKTLQKDFREELREVEIPPYFVSQGDYTKHIIFPELQGFLAFVYPPEVLHSKREYRHFYNRLSFRYLESVSNTYDVELSHNSVGKIKTLIP